MDHDMPPMIVSPKAGETDWSQAQIARMNLELDRFRQRGGTLVVGFPCDVRQLVDGRWELLPTKAEGD